jgi:hypothetical protein
VGRDIQPVNEFFLSHEAISLTRKYFTASRLPTEATNFPSLPRCHLLCHRSNLLPRDGDDDHDDGVHDGDEASSLDRAAC